MIVHQHLAHQRVLYEELLKNMTVKEAVSQQLLFPLKLSFSVPAIALLTGIKEQLEHTGFIFQTMKGDQLEITGLPVGVLESHVEGILQELVYAIESEVPDAGFSQNDLLAKSMAKSMAIKTGMPLSATEREHLINQLFACKEPSVSPENKKVFHTLDVAEVDKKFM